VSWYAIAFALSPSILFANLRAFTIVATISCIESVWRAILRIISISLEDIAAASSGGNTSLILQTVSNNKA